MNFLKKETGRISYEKIGEAISKLQKESWITIDDFLSISQSDNSANEIIPALELFEKLGHIDLEENNSSCKLKVLSSRRTISEREKKEIKKTLVAH